MSKEELSELNKLITKYFNSINDGTLRRDELMACAMVLNKIRVSYENI